MRKTESNKLFVDDGGVVQIIITCHCGRMIQHTWAISISDRQELVKIDIIIALCLIPINLSKEFSYPLLLWG
jgi:hypothetical protein